MMRLLLVLEQRQFSKRRQQPADSLKAPWRKRASYCTVALVAFALWSATVANLAAHNGVLVPSLTSGLYSEWRVYVRSIGSIPFWNHDHLASR